MNNSRKYNKNKYFFDEMIAFNPIMPGEHIENTNKT